MPNLFAAMSGRYAFTHEELAAIRGACRSRDFAAGEVVFRKGESGESMFILHSGSVEVELGFRDRFVLDEDGDYFGELAFVHPDHRRSATVRALSDARLSVLDQAVVGPLFLRHPDALLKLFRRVCAFIIDSEERLIGNLVQKNQELQRSYDFLRRTQQELSNQELLAQTDELTGLYNRRCLMEQLTRAGQHHAETGEPIGLLMVDLDRFKQVNDSHGHASGDEVLRQVADALRRNIRSDDLPCRIGGDELAVLVHGCDQEPAERRAEEIRTAIAALPPVQPGAPQVSASIGGTMLREGEAVEDMMRRADANLYEAKASGRDRVVWVL